VLAAHLGLPLRAALDAYAEGYEAMAAVAAASHPVLYDAGWHPTSVCRPIGAVVAASRLLDLAAAQRENALALALLRAGGTRGAFGSDGKAIQVGLAAAAGVQAALLARAGAIVDRRAIHGPLGFEGVLGVRWPQVGAGGELHGDSARAIDGNWIKMHPSCLGTQWPSCRRAITTAVPTADLIAEDPKAPRPAAADRASGADHRAQCQCCPTRASSGSRGVRRAHQPSSRSGTDHTLPGALLAIHRFEHETVETYGMATRPQRARTSRCWQPTAASSPAQILRSDPGRPALTSAGRRADRQAPGVYNETPTN
jgi:MmgE/PrpD N-terminal domain